MKRLNVIGVSGKARAGKDTLFSIAKRDGYIRLSFAKELKRRARKDMGLTVEHTDGKFKDIPVGELNGHTPREFLIELGNLYRNYRPSFWVDIVLDKIKANPNKKYMITDVRYLNEAVALKALGAELIRLERHPSRDCMVDAKTKVSLSETALDNYKDFDYVLKGERNRVSLDLALFWDSVKHAKRLKFC